MSPPDLNPRVACLGLFRSNRQIRNHDAEALEKSDSQPGIGFGLTCTCIGVTEDHQKGHLHFHITINRHIPGYALQQFANLPEIFAARLLYHFDCTHQISESFQKEILPLNCTKQQCPIPDVGRVSKGRAQCATEESLQEPKKLVEFPKVGHNVPLKKVCKNPEKHVLKKDRPPHKDMSSGDMGGNSNHAALHAGYCILLVLFRMQGGIRSGGGDSIVHTRSFGSSLPMLGKLFGTITVRLSAWLAYGYTERSK
ncbi:expressed unknown protein [Seminavis robusta]|uniref:Uncharacterized protein n=1 Tax=Seminavis robusta TaxID=568900 RepID=A0A9N8EQW2_9STRA|nr:expressed unknown protein [Seminavis robusta]|eukprot:Sro1695_g291740.1 n/a (254) ;mRNA; r:6546-7396